MTNDQRNSLIVKILGGAVVVAIIALVAMTPIGQNVWAMTLIGSIVTGLAGALGFAGTDATVIAKLTSMEPSKRVELIQRSLPPGARVSIAPHAGAPAITFEGFDPSVPPPAAVPPVPPPSGRLS